MNSKALYIRGERVTAARGGADVVSQAVLSILRSYFDNNIEDLYIEELRGGKPSRSAVLFSALIGHFEPYNTKSKKILLKHLEGSSFAFIDQSVYGKIVEDIQKADKTIKTAVLFHNIEKQFYTQRILKLGKVHNAPLLPAIIKAESTAAKKADLVIVVSPRDAETMNRVYGRIPDLVLLPPVEDRLPPEKTVHESLKNHSEFTMLFVGSAFPPNLEGVRWFVREVMPFVHGTLFIVGHGFENFRIELERSNVRVIGGVPDLTPWYTQSDCVISPIFWGQGIKVKTAEAYMYGKIVIGTQEAFEGYDYQRAGSYSADSKNDFVEVLQRIYDQAQQNDISFSKKARAYYEEVLSMTAQYQRIAHALDSILKRP